MSIADQNPQFESPEPSEEQLRAWVRKINDKSLSWEERDAAKNELMLAHANFIWDRVFNWTGGRVGISDRQTENFDSAFVYLKERASQIAQAVEGQDINLLAAIAQRIMGWARDKIRRSDGQTDQRGKRHSRQSAAVLDDVAVSSLSPDEEVSREEWLGRVKAAVFSAVSDLNGDEQAVILSYFGLNGPELTIREIADQRGITLTSAHNARRRAQDKLRKWLAHHNPDNIAD